MNVIKRNVFILTDKIKDPIEYLQGTNAIPIEFSFRDFDIPANSEVRVLVEKPSGHKRFEEVTTISGNVVTVYPDQQMMAEAGISGMQLEIVNRNEILATFLQPVNIKRTAIPIRSGSGSGFLEDIIKDAETATDRANEVSDRIEKKAQAGDFSATVKVGSTVTGDPGTPAAVKNSGTTKDAVLDFTIPKGVPGVATSLAPGIFGMYIREDGHLIVRHNNNDPAPPLKVIDGHLVYVIEED
jgi:hypothetical protein